MSVVNGQVLINGVLATNYPPTANITVEITGDVNILKVAGSATVTGNVNQNVDAGGSITVGGNVSGDVDAGGSVGCVDVGGNVDAGGSVKCGRVTGSIDAGGSVRHG